MRNKGKILIFFLALLLITGSAYAAGQMGNHSGDGPKIHGHNLLNLTPEQKTKLKELRDNFRKDTVFLRNNIRVKRLELRALWTVPQPEKDKIMAKQKELMDLVSQLQTRVVDFRLEFRSMLTPEQAALVGIWGPKMFKRGHMGRRMVAIF